MRIVHTADWHVGRVWKGTDRLEETAAILDHLARFLEREKIDLLLVAGDIFDVPNPGADAEALVFGFFRRLEKLRLPAVLIAGNHDHPIRMEAYGALSELAGVHIVGRPRPAERGGVVEMAGRDGTRALVAALPFAAPASFVSALDLARDDNSARPLYAEKFQQAAAALAGAFHPDSVNIFMAHTHVEGAVLAESERQIHFGADWAARADALPSAAHYVALGHVHKPQRIESAPVLAEYAGSPLQLDFGEVGQAKSFVMIEAAPGRPARVRRIPWEGGRVLLDLQLTLREVEVRAGEFGSNAWLRVTVPLDEPDPDLARKVRQHLPTALVIRPELPACLLPPRLSRRGKTPVEMYREYHQRQHERPPDPGVEEAFVQLYQQCDEE